MKCKEIHSQLDNVSHRQYSKQKNRWKQDIHARNVSYYQQNSCLNLDSCWKLERHYKKVIAQSTAFLNTNKGKMKWSVKIDILNWIMFHTDISVNRRAIGDKRFTSKWKLLSTEQLFEPRFLLETREVLYTRQLSQKELLFRIGIRWKMTWIVNIEIINWIMFQTDNSLSRRTIWNKTFTR